MFHAITMKNCHGFPHLTLFGLAARLIDFARKQAKFLLKLTTKSATTTFRHVQNSYKIEN